MACTRRALLTLEEKHVPYSRELVNLKDKPDWCAKLSFTFVSSISSCGARGQRGRIDGVRRLFQVNEKGTTPVIKDLATGEWITESAQFVDT